MKEYIVTVSRTDVVHESCIVECECCPSVFHISWIGPLAFRYIFECVFTDVSQNSQIMSMFVKSFCQDCVKYHTTEDWRFFFERTSLNALRSYSTRFERATTYICIWQRIFLAKDLRAYWRTIRNLRVNFYSA